MKYLAFKINMTLLWIGQIIASLIEPQNVGIIFMIALCGHLINNLSIKGERK